MSARKFSSTAVDFSNNGTSDNPLERNVSMPKHSVH